MSHIAFSRGLRGATRGVSGASVSSAVNARRLVLPLGSFGRSASRTTWLGTMYSGKVVASARLSAAESSAEPQT